jgi:serine/threonine protein kinase
MHILLGKIGSARGWVWIDAKVDGKPYVGGMPPVTALANEADVKTAFFTVYRFERIFGSAEAFYEAYFEVAMREHAEQEMLLSIGDDGGMSADSDGHRDKETSLDGVAYDLSYFDSIELIAPINMGFAALAFKTLPADLASSGGESKDALVIKEYVLKRLNKTAVCAQKFSRVVKAEAHILSTLNSPFIAKLFGKFQTADELVLVLERCTGGDLWTVIYEEESLRDDDGFLPMHVVRFYAGSIALALEHMHDRNIAYRNLKPETVLLDRNGYIRLTGMGFAKRVPFINAQGTLSGQTFTFCGTLEYLSPEMVLNLGHDQGVDKWALGVTIYEMICGITPFEVDMSTYTNVSFSAAATERSNAMTTLEEAFLGDDEEPQMARRSNSMDSSMEASLDTRLRAQKRLADEATASTTAYADYKNSPPPTPSGADTPERRRSYTSTASGGKSRGGAGANDASHMDNTSKLIATIAAVRNVPAVLLPHDFTHIKGGIEGTLLLTQLLMPDPSERLGIRRDYVNNIFEHEFFADYDWEHLLDGRGHRCNDVQPPYIPHAQADIKMGRRGAEELPPLPKSEPFTGNNAIFADF